jgi:hypothetical protein
LAKAGRGAAPGEDDACGTPLTRVAALRDLGPLFAAQARDVRERCSDNGPAMTGGDEET